ncbi:MULTISPECIES: DUF6266 family protein [unclassified Pedobacter]|uniref:DUF6266 family protein n=1 Tax=unclassified Pedobacter TaxID=2628915 RepID=UPI00142038F4|nr:MULTISPECIES: DUF6266 family protein [unclassified Pedobacter]NII81966.1 hypothetical protein [Pedobacter sp. SG908]NMN35970.1 hypothetical protein [Pedobacter sp. SG918]
MGKIENGINGGFTGTVGAVTGYYLVIRSKRRKSIKNKIGSADQKTCRSRFTMMQTFLSPIVGFIRIGFNLESKKRMMTAHNVAKSYNMLNAQNATGEIDYAAVRLSFGNLTGAEGVKLEHDDAGVHFSWTDNANGDYNRKHDQVMLMVYDVDNKTAIYETGGARRFKERESLEIPSFYKGRTFHTWIAFIADDRMGISASTYCGSFVF